MYGGRGGGAPTSRRSWRSSRACCSEDADGGRVRGPEAQACWALWTDLGSSAWSRRRPRPCSPSGRRRRLHPVLRAARLPHVGGTKNPDIDAIVALAPDLVVVDEEENRREDAEALAAAGLDLLVLAVRTVDGALAAVARAGAAVRSAGARPDRAGRRPAPARRRAFVPIWRRPWMTINADTYGASVLRRRHRARDGRPGRALPDGRAGGLAARPDVVLVPSEPYSFTAAHVDELGRRSRRRGVELVDGQDLFWWGTRTPGASTGSDGSASDSLNCSSASTSNGARRARFTWSAPASTYSPMRSTTSVHRAAEHARADPVAIAPNCGAGSPRSTPGRR